MIMVMLHRRRSRHSRSHSRVDSLGGGGGGALWGLFGGGGGGLGGVVWGGAGAFCWGGGVAAASHRGKRESTVRFEGSAVLGHADESSDSLY